MYPRLGPIASSLPEGMSALSACGWDLGAVKGGEAVCGLGQAFAIARAETQMLSLWQIGDDGTQSLMARYDGTLTDDGMGRSEALSQVQWA